MLCEDVEGVAALVACQATHQPLKGQVVIWCLLLGLIFFGGVVRVCFVSRCVKQFVLRCVKQSDGVCVGESGSGGSVHFHVEVHNK